MSFGGGQNALDQKIQLEMVFSLINNCFNDCVNDFRSGELSSSEKTCLSNCAQKSTGTQNLLMEVQQDLQNQMGGGGGF
jgi:hypothetical protein